jgi:LuxR family transcriptional regulator of spore coat protein
MPSILTKREREVFELLVQNKSTEEIAEILYISKKTVRNHISNVIQKLNVRGRAYAVITVIRTNEISL